VLKSTSKANVVLLQRVFMLFCFMFCSSVLPHSVVQCFRRNLLPPEANIYGICTLSWTTIPQFKYLWPRTTRLCYHFSVFREEKNAKWTHPVSEVFKQNTGVILGVCCQFPIWPSSQILELLGQIPVIHSNLKCNTSTLVQSGVSVSAVWRLCCL
jgi:hypothetical protein